MTLPIYKQGVYQSVSCLNIVCFLPVNVLMWLTRISVFRCDFHRFSMLRWQIFTYRDMFIPYMCLMSESFDLCREKKLTNFSFYNWHGYCLKTEGTRSTLQSRLISINSCKNIYFCNIQTKSIGFPVNLFALCNIWWLKRVEWR